MPRGEASVYSVCRTTSSNIWAADDGFISFLLGHWQSTRQLINIQTSLVCEAFRQNTESESGPTRSYSTTNNEQLPRQSTAQLTYTSKTKKETNTHPGFGWCKNRKSWCWDITSSLLSMRNGGHASAIESKNNNARNQALMTGTHDRHTWQALLTVPTLYWSMLSWHAEKVFFLPFTVYSLLQQPPLLVSHSFAKSLMHLSSTNENVSRLIPTTWRLPVLIPCLDLHFNCEDQFTMSTFLCTTKAHQKLYAQVSFWTPSWLCIQTRLLLHTLLNHFTEINNKRYLSRRIANWVHISLWIC